MIAFSCIFLQKVVNGFGESVVAANTALGRIEQLVQQPYNSLGAAITTYTGQNIGAGKMDRVKQGDRAAFWSVGNLFHDRLYMGAEGDCQHGALP